MIRPSRRSVLGGSISLLFGWPAIAAETGGGAAPALPSDLAAAPEIDRWLRLSADGRVTLRTGKVELGQGVLTAYAQLCAEELDIHVSRIDVIAGDTRVCPRQGMTVGSFSIPEGGKAIRMVSAEMRQILIRLAAEKLSVPTAALDVRDGMVRTRDGRSVAYGSLAGGQTVQRRATGAVLPKARPRRVVGTSVARLDLPAKVRGAPAFLQDYRPVGMLHARMVRPPSAGARLLAVEIAPARAMPDVVTVVRDGDFLAVVAEREWSAVKAAAQLASDARWDTPPPLPADPIAWLKDAATQDTVIASTGTPPSAGTRLVRRSYSRPYLLHGSIGPSCAVAHFDGTALHLCTSSQGPFELAAVIAKLVGLPVDRVTAQHMQGAGCYGHNGADDATADAALIAMRLPGRPIRVQWSRQDEHRFEPFGAPMLIETEAHLDDRGNIMFWDYALRSPTHNARPVFGVGNLLAAPTLAQPTARPKTNNFGGPPAYAADRNAIPSYVFPGLRVTTRFVPESPVRTSSLRSLGAHGNVFAIESMMDECALAAGVDPLAYRLRHATDPRAQAVMQRACDAIDWSHPRPADRGCGMAYARYKNYAAYCAIAIEVEIREGEPVLVRATLAADAGEIVNPDGLRNQLEGGLLQSLSWARHEAVRFDGAGVASRDWRDYPILTIGEAPPVEVILIDRPDQPSLGAGEASQGPASAAFANAVARACGARVRNLPIDRAAIAAARVRA
ncbi:CO/xanthine dehydrogenase Mo-binding subunit [Sphingomonas vulcanisoli]|uniref:CO/xanthine dehydrogenase Mo-binding subunit n=1 Tax=Sphingomonas vulcanisoli TaxID=1658060 RepID=A0ABX0U0W9_9SPHN|nr:molybdopterin cofactor-binding domain-containing protein [Sphingomonas vulcanisoli]NIJ09640.1 CO/xanthine dehydrogenase Mo-binding subunit [Sphingomonas vulcanisoli]